MARVPVAIGSEAWWKTLRRLGGRREVVAGSIAANVSAADADPKTIDPHAFRPPKGAPIERAASVLLLFAHVPTYATLMHVAHEWAALGLPGRGWLARQYASLLVHGTDAQREAIKYSLWCDYFEVPKRARVMFPRILAVLPEAFLGDLLEISGPVRWALKRVAYERALATPRLHGALAMGLQGSFYDIQGSVHPVEARSLVRRIRIDDVEIASALEAITTRPLRIAIVAVFEVRDGDEGWPHRGSFLVLVRLVGDLKKWTPGAEILHDGRCIGRLRHWAFPFDRPLEMIATPKGTTIPESLNEDGSVLVRIEGSAPAMRALIGETLDAWPEGLAPVR
jgi:hypothetical protein